MMDSRKLAEERKNYFETMERHIFSSKQSTKGTGRESVATSDPNKSSIDGRGEDDDEEEDEKVDEMAVLYEEAFTKMKRAAGVSSTQEVVKRFETQEGTGNHLQDLQSRAEKEIRDLGVVKESLEAEWELVNNNILNIKSRE
ncbi:uncharacterized protein LOC111715727 [Eurytemora carolleeae]|uniref:uncharacterized protein LOC111715727 n=1 Tax=Eurytemora carolleeae TaxID=1294199 RepID=UPI000C77A0EC|nr:uncharacterized protein LOC111715727 [Eurytemora carolleeae]|eukprot:XP_023346861.1 uncharacterized protein LOC111715727 [Eurytemora affinis]